MSTAAGWRGRPSARQVTRAANPNASFHPGADAAVSESWNPREAMQEARSAAETASPRAMPTLRVVARAAPPTPRLSAGTFPITALLFGVWNAPMPIPITAKQQAMSQSGDAAPSHPKIPSAAAMLLAVKTRLAKRRRGLAARRSARTNARARAMAIAVMPSDFPRRSAGTADTMMAFADDIISAALRPWSTRAPIRKPMLAMNVLCMRGSAMFTAFESKLHMKVPNATVRTVAMPDLPILSSMLTH
jgi:hypothetical protein